jgi:hypothetical protein
MSNEKTKSKDPIDFSHLGGKFVGLPVVDQSAKKPIDFSRLGGKRVGQALGRSEDDDR